MEPYDNKTIDEIKTLIVDGLQQQWNKKLRILPKSFIKTFAAVLAAVYIILFKQIGWLFLQIFPETAYWGEITVLGIRVRPLVKWGVLLGVGEPRRGSQWQGKIQINVTKKNTFLDTGTQLKSDTTGKIYLIDETIALENDTELTAVMCSSLGTAGNLEEGETLCFVSPLGNVKKEAIVTEVIKKAINDETQADYRYRVVNRWRVQPQGGSLSDYRIWGLDVPGVLNIYPYNDDNSPAGVLIYVSGNPAIYPDRIPSSELLIAVGKSCTYNPETGKADRKPITAIIDPEKNERYTNVKPVTIKTFDVYIERLSGITAPEFSEYVKTPIGEYFLGRESYIRGLSDDNNKTSLVSRNNVLSVVDQVAMPLKAEFENVIMKQGDTIISTYTLGMGELCALNNLYINGEVF